MVKNKICSSHSKVSVMGLLALPLLAAIGTTIISDQAASAQLTPSQQNAARSLVATGYTNHYPMNPPRTWCTGCPNITIPYSINLGQLITIAPDQPRTSLDIILAPTQHQSAPGLLTIQIPRYLLDSKNPSGADTPFRVTLDGHGLSWGQIQSTDTYRVLALYFTSQNGFLQIFGNTGAVTKAFPTNH
ncbi:MAG: hypothetical protein WAK17_21085 [Candidatus Nitrosopolaris sp.]|jgi:hypothetical protein